VLNSIIQEYEELSDFVSAAVDDYLVSPEHTTASQSKNENEKIMTLLDRTTADELSGILIRLQQPSTGSKAELAASILIQLKGKPLLPADRETIPRRLLFYLDLLGSFDVNEFIFGRENLQVKWLVGNVVHYAPFKATEVRQGYVANPGSLFNYYL